MRFLIVVVICVIAVACVGTFPEEMMITDSGIVGVVTIGPTCPETIDATQCPNAPYVAKLEIQDGKNNRWSVMSGPQGNFKIDLPAGEYLVFPQTENMIETPRKHSIKLNIESGNYTKILVEYNSGIRK